MSQEREQEQTFFGLSGMTGGRGNGNGRKSMTLSVIKLLWFMGLFTVGQVSTAVWFASSISFQVKAATAEVVQIKQELSEIRKALGSLSRETVRINMMEETIKEMRLRLRSLERRR
tara:strand:+ start:177 stop:524 length:348 start_codon:yes stop_codon:yes gene_type:complete